MKDVFTGDTYNGYPLSESKKNSEGFRVDILQAIESLFVDMVKRHASVFFVRFDLRFPARSPLRHTGDNALVSRFSELFMLHCKRKKYDPRYLWAREYSKRDNVHYHFILLLNDDYIQNAHVLIKNKATELWQLCLGIEDNLGLVDLCKTHEFPDYGGIKIRRRDPHFQQVFERCYQWASYLAKRYSKGESPGYTNEYRGSHRR